MKRRMGRPHLRLLGALTVGVAHEESVVLPTKKAALLLARLACAGAEGLSRHQLTALFWADRGEKQARGSLRQALFGLRRAFEPFSVIETAADRVIFRTGAVWLDVAELERVAIEPIPIALPALYRGPLLAGTEPLDSPFDAWLEAERARLHRLAIGGLARLLRAQRSTDRERAEATAAHLAALEPTAEEAHRVLAEALAERGDRSGALRVLHELRDRLARELDTEPEPETAALAMHLRRTATSGPSRVEMSSKRVPAPSPPPAAAHDDPRQRRHAVIAHVRAASGPVEADLEADHDQHQALLEKAHQVAATFRGLVRARGTRTVELVFGVPHAYGDEAQRALTAAYALLEGAPQLRIGIAAGDVVLDASDPASAVVGPPVERAERWAVEAAEGRACVDARLVAVAELHLDIETEPLVDGRVHVRAVRPKASLTPFTGRRAELSQLLSIIDATAREGVGRVICVRGEAGIGKTRLIRQLAHEAERQGFRSHFAYVLDFGGPSRRDALRSLIRGLAGVADADPSAAADASVRGMRSALERPDDEVFLRELLDAPLSTSQRGLLDAMKPDAREAGLRRVATSVVRAASARAPQLLVVEDLHWAEEETTAALAELCEVVDEAPVLFAMTTRVEGDPLDASFRGRVYGLPITTIDLGPLSSADIETFGRHLGASPDAIASCRARTGGHPLFMEQLLRSPAEAQTDGVPTSVRSLVQARLDRLEPPVRARLQAASVLGQRFSADALAHLADQPGDRVDDLVRAGFVRTEGATLTFTHALLRDGVYESLLARRRRSLHQRAGAYFLDRDLVLAAEHFEKANDPWAPEVCLRAAEHLRNLYRLGDALRLAERGHALSVDPALATRSLLSIGWLRHDVGDMTGAHAAFEEALIVTADEATRARAFLGRAGVRRIIDDLPGAHEDVDAAEAAAERAGLEPELAQVCFLRGNLLFPQGDGPGCKREHDRSLAIARACGRPDLEAVALGGLGDAQYLMGRMRSAARTLEACVRLCQELGLGRVEVANSSQLGGAMCHFAPLGTTLALLEEAKRKAERVGDRRAQVNATACQIWPLWEMGDLERCRRVADELLTTIRELDACWRYAPLGEGYLGVVDCLTGHRGRGLARLEKARADSEASGPGFHGVEVYGHIALFARDSAVRRGALERGRQILATGAFVGHCPLRFRPLAARVEMEMGNLELAQAELDALRAFTKDEPLATTDLWLDVLRLALDARRGAVSIGQLEVEVQELEARARLLDAHRIAFEARTLLGVGSSRAERRSDSSFLDLE